MHKSNNVLLINEQFTAVYPSLVKTLNSLTLAVVLQTIHFKSQLTKDGWVDCTMQDLADSTGLSRDGIQRALTKLRQKNLLFEDNQDGYSNARRWKIDHEALNELASTAISHTRNRTIEYAESHIVERDIALSTITKETIKNNKNTYSEIPNEAITICELLADFIAARGVKRPKVTPKWHQEMDKIHRLDDYSWDEIEQVIRWMHESNQDSFWYKVVLSPTKLRIQMTAIQMRMKQTSESNSNIAGWARVIAQLENEQKELEQ